MKKLFTLLTLALLSIGTAWAAIGDTFTVTFNGSASQTTANYFTISSNPNFNTKFTGATYDNVTYTSGLKMESGTTISWTAEAEHTLIILQSSWEKNGGTPKTNKLDGTTIETNTATTGTGYYLYTIENVAAGNHSITRGGGENGLFMVRVVYTGESVDIVANPQITWNSGTKKATITCATNGATIYYTTDGTTPTTSSDVYSSEISIINSTTVCAFAKKGEATSGFAKQECYIDNSSSALAVLNRGDAADAPTWTDGVYSMASSNSSDISYYTIFNGKDGFKLNPNVTYTIDIPEGIKVTSVKLIGKTRGDAANNTTVSFAGCTPASAEFEKGVFVKTVEYTPSTALDFGDDLSFEVSGNQFGAYIELYGEIKKYAVTYAAGTNGTGSIAAGEKTHDVNFALSSSTFTRDGFVQTGWATSDGGAKVYALGGSYTANADITLYPVWAKGDSYAFNFTDGKTISQLEALGWTFNSATFDADPADTEAYVNLVSAMNTAGLSAPKTNISVDGIDNALAFTKSTSAYAQYDLGGTYTVYQMNATLYGGSSSSFDVKIDYIGADGTTVKKSYTNALNAGNWAANNITKSDEVADVRYIKVYGASKWVVMSAFSVNYHLGSASVGTLADRNYATYVTSQKLDFSAADGITAYIATGLNGASDAVVLQEVDVVPAGEPIIVKTETKGATVNVPVTDAAADDVSGNKLVAGDGTTSYSAGTYYFLKEDKFHLATSGTLQTGKAYLLMAGSLAPVLNIFFGDVTGINEVQGSGFKVNGYYDLQGRKVVQPTKGLYIVNGKKIVIK